MVRKPILYGTENSPTVKAVLLTIKALPLAIDYDFRIVSPNRGDHLKPEYLQKNPAHTIPTWETEEGTFIGDSHAIMAYLVGKYGQYDDELYPRDLYKRAVVDQRLHFENGVLFINCVKAALGPIFAGLRNDVPAEKLQAMDKAYSMLEGFFGENAFVAGETMTIADFSCVTSVTSMCFVRPIDEEKHPKLTAWLERMKALPYFDEVNENESSMAVAKFLSKKLSKL